MPKKTIRKYLPDYHSIKEQKSLKLFGSLLHSPNLWHLNRHSACGAFGIGLFFAFWPVPFQMWLSAATAIAARVNLPLSVATVWITNPFTMPPIFYGAYKVGVLVAGAPEQEFAFELSWSWLMASINTIGPVFLLGCLICSVVAGVLGYFGLQIAWRLQVTRAWEKRKLRFAMLRKKR